MTTLPKWNSHHIEDVEVNLLLYALKERYGYDFMGYARASLKRRLLELTSYFDVEHLSQLIPIVLYDETVAQTVINHIFVPTSDFFRNPVVWDYLRTKVLPQLASFPRINVWQAGCGYGQEAYSLVILLHEAGLLKRSRLFSSDINPLFLDKARLGCWSIEHKPQWSDNYLQAGGTGNFTDFFVETESDIRIRSEFKQPIEFIQHNLVVDDVFKEMQLVVCRNVLLYFGNALQEYVVNLLTRSLERGGYLLLGRAEYIVDLSEKHPQLELLDGVLQLYRKRIGTS
ncbi:MAG: CheR family methyltransferase [Methylococcales bacterium]|nr:CheR family methyltransferase [Methylococcales bacterium]MDP3838517.1 CheR family methyltransferase [Methylococcales bacterium]